MRIGVVTHVAVLGILVHGLVLQRTAWICFRCLIIGGLAEVGSISGAHFIGEDVAVGADGIVHACFLTAGIDNGLAVWTPVELLAAAERKHRTFVRLSVQNVGGLVRDACSVKVGQEDMWNGAHIMIPMLIVQICDDHTAGQGQIVVGLLNGSGCFYFLNQNHLFVVGREFETLYTLLGERQLLAVASVESGLPYFRFAAGSAQESQMLAVGQELRFHLAGISLSKELFVRSVGIHQIDQGAALVLLHTVVSHGIGNLLAVR